MGREQLLYNDFSIAFPEGSATRAMHVRAKETIQILAYVTLAPMLDYGAGALNEYFDSFRNFAEEYTSHALQYGDPYGVVMVDNKNYDLSAMTVAKKWPQITDENKRLLPTIVTQIQESISYERRIMTENVYRLPQRLNYHTYHAFGRLDLRRGDSVTAAELQYEIMNAYDQDEQYAPLLEEHVRTERGVHGVYKYIRGTGGYTTQRTLLFNPVRETDNVYTPNDAYFLAIQVTEAAVAAGEPLAGTVFNTL